MSEAKTFAASSEGQGHPEVRMEKATDMIEERGETDGRQRLP